MEIIRVEDIDLTTIEANRCRTFRAVSQPLTAQHIWDDICTKKRQRVIVICNTVSQAQGLYRDLENLNEDLNENIEDELLVTGGKFIQTKIFPEFSIHEAEALFEILVFLAIFTHDLGKLQSKWQQVMQGWQKIAHEKYQGKNPRRYLLAHTDYNPEDKQQKAELKAYEKKNKRPNHAVESAFLAKEILTKSLVPLLRHYNCDTEQIKYFCYTVMMAAGRHHSAWAEGFQSSDVARLQQIELSEGYEKAIADSWRCMIRFLPDVLPLSQPNLSRNIYKLNNLDLDDFFGRDEVEFLQLYSLVVRALRLCDQRSVQLI